MTEREVVIGHRLGVHARVAAKLVQLSAGFKSNIELLRSEQGESVTADARSILSILFMAAGFGAREIMDAATAVLPGLQRPAQFVF